MTITYMDRDHDIMYLLLQVHSYFTNESLHRLEIIHVSKCEATSFF